MLPKSIVLYLSQNKWDQSISNTSKVDTNGIHIWVTLMHIIWNCTHNYLNFFFVFIGYVYYLNEQRLLQTIDCFDMIFHTFSPLLTLKVIKYTLT